jgi:hypothetical protein
MVWVALFLGTFVAGFAANVAIALPNAECRQSGSVEGRSANLVQDVGQRFLADTQKTQVAFSRQ